MVCHAQTGKRKLLFTFLVFLRYSIPFQFCTPYSVLDLEITYLLVSCPAWLVFCWELVTPLFIPLTHHAVNLLHQCKFTIRRLITTIIWPSIISGYERKLNFINTEVSELAHPKSSEIMSILQYTTFFKYVRNLV